MGVFAISAGFVAIAAWLGPGADPVVFWGAGGFFLVCAIIAATQMAGMGASLSLDVDGFTCRTLFRTWRRRWDDCSAFVPVAMSGNRFVAFSSATDEREKPKLSAANRALIGATGMLPETYGLDADELAGLMNAFRERALG